MWPFNSVINWYQQRQIKKNLIKGKLTVDYSQLIGDIDVRNQAAKKSYSSTYGNQSRYSSPVVGTASDRTNVNTDGDFLTSMAIAQATNSAALGYAMGGSLTGALLGDTLNTSEYTRNDSCSSYSSDSSSSSSYDSSSDSGSCSSSSD